VGRGGKVIRGAGARVGGGKGNTRGQRRRGADVGVLGGRGDRLECCGGLGVREREGRRRVQGIGQGEGVDRR